MFSFSPKSEAEIEALMNMDLLPEGEYDFQVKEVTDKISQSGNHMLVAKVEVYFPGGSMIVTDYLTTTDKMIFKLRHFCESVNRLDQYDNGNLNLDSFKGSRGKLRLGIQKGKPKPDGSGNFADRNAVLDYVKPTAGVAQKAEFNDDITF